MPAFSELCNVAFSFPAFQVIRIKLYQKTLIEAQLSSWNCIILSLKVSFKDTIISIFSNLALVNSYQPFTFWRIHTKLSSVLTWFKLSSCTGCLFIYGHTLARSLNTLQLLLNDQFLLTVYTPCYSRWGSDTACDQQCLCLLPSAFTLTDEPQV